MSSSQCAACETPRTVLSKSGHHIVNNDKGTKSKKVAKEEDEEEEYEGSSDEGSGRQSDEDEEIGLRESKGFDVVVGSALAKDNKQKLSKLAEATKKKLGEKKFAVSIAFSVA